MQKDFECITHQMSDVSHSFANNQNLNSCAEGFYPKSEVNIYQNSNEVQNLNNTVENLDNKNVFPSKIDIKRS